jgi:hypothetical protein
MPKEIKSKAFDHKTNPGSKAARKKGCTCPVIDNHYGEGIPCGEELHFYMSQNCPLHGWEEGDA